MRKSAFVLFALLFIGSCKEQEVKIDRIEYSVGPQFKEFLNQWMHVEGMANLDQFYFNSFNNTLYIKNAEDKAVTVAKWEWFVININSVHGVKIKNASCDTSFSIDFTLNISSKEIKNEGHINSTSKVKLYSFVPVDEMNSNSFSMYIQGEFSEMTNISIDYTACRSISQDLL